jgi:putative DNA primase/helicase
LTIDAANAPQHFNGGPQNVGVVLGPASGGLTDADLDCAQAVTVAPYLLPRTAAIFGRTGKRASHWLYTTDLSTGDAPAALRFRTPDKTTLCELRIGGGKGAQTVFPPSVHESGEAIAWEPDCNGEPAKVDGEDLLKRVQRVAAAALLAQHWPTAQGGRHDTALVVGGFLARCGFGEAETGVLLEAIAKAAGDEEWSDRVAAGRDAVRQHRDGGRHFGFPALVEAFGKAVATRVAKWLGANDCEPVVAPPPSTDAAPTDQAPAFSEEAIALRFAAERAGDTRYVAAWSKWLRYDGKCWRTDETVATFDAVRATCRAVALEIAKPNMRRAICSAKTVAAVERLARSDRRLAATAEQWDADIWALNTPGGVVDLGTGKLRSHQVEEYMTKVTAVAPGGDCPLWRAFLERITDGDRELQQFQQRWCGYALTGSTREHALGFGHGVGANGKSVFTSTITGILADYATTAPIETFTVTASEQHPTELARLRGARLVVATETEEGRRWAESKIKMLTGGDRTAARFMRQDFFEFTPQFKLWIVGNHKPGLRSVNEAIRRRFLLVPFNVVIPEAERDKDLAEKLKAEWPGILQWMIEGALEWRRIGLAPPAAVTNATSAYLESEDAVALWLDECTVADPNAWESSSALFGSWKAWAERTGEYVGTQRRFLQSLETKPGAGVVWERRMHARGYRGRCITAAHWDQNR